LVGQATRLVRGAIKTLPPPTQRALDGASWRAAGPTRGEDGMFFLNIENGRGPLRRGGGAQALAAKPGDRSLLFAVAASPPKTKVKSILAQVEFLDNHPGQPLVLEYDSWLAEGEAPGYRRAALRGGGERTGSSKWKRATFLLDQPVFAGRPPVSGADFCLQGE